MSFSQSLGLAHTPDTALVKLHCYITSHSPTSLDTHIDTTLHHTTLSPTSLETDAALNYITLTSISLNILLPYTTPFPISLNTDTTPHDNISHSLKAPRLFQVHG